MPTSVTSTSSTSYHLWQLPDESAPEPEDSTEYTTIKNEMSEGHRSSALLGLNTGLRTFKLNIPTASSYVSRSGFAATLYTPTATGVSGVSCTREQYIRTLFALNKTGGVPFVYQYPPTTGQYYLVDFADDSLEMAKVKGANIYSTSVTLKQRRIAGETVFNVAGMAGYANMHWYNETSHGTGVWNDIQTSSPLNLTAVNDVVFNGNAQNGLNTVRLSGTTANGGLTKVTGTDITDVFIACKIREATFTGTQSIIHPIGASDTTTGILKGTASSANINAALDLYKNGTNYPTGITTGPMNAFAVFQLSTPQGVGWEALVDNIIAWGIGHKPITGGQSALMDIGELVISSVSVPQKDAYQLTEFLQAKWGVTT